MSGRRQSVIVSRDYQPAPDDCARALMLLLKKSVSEKATEAGGPDDAEGSKNDRTATEIIPG